MSLYLVSALVGISLVCIVLAIHYAQDSSREKAKRAEDALESVRAFNEEAAKPLRRGSDLVRAMRARARLRERNREPSGVPDPEREDD